jgi:endonuclease-3
MRDQDIRPVIQILKKEVQKWKLPVLGQYSRNPFTILIACLLSLRTQDKTTDEASARLFELAATPQDMLKLSAATIQKAIYPVGFYKTKAENIKTICRILWTQNQGQVPDDLDELLKLPGVGRKTANLVITLAYQKPGICVDTHVHRITNRWGYIQAKTPEKTEMALRQKLPRRYWIIINELLVRYGQNICKPISPLCSRCKISRYCERAGVGKSR